MRHACATWLVALGVLTPLVGAGCSSGPRVPSGAMLIWYGSNGFSLPKEDLPSGTLYLVEESTGRTINAMYRPAGVPLHFGGMKEGRNYRLYFVEGSMAPMTTRPAGG
jgi:hypothetical protein